MIPVQTYPNRKAGKPFKAQPWMLTPLFGSLLYMLLYIVATLFYPGGSQFDKQSKGFSWLQNYWCNLLNENAINGQPNVARPIAFTALMVLCLTLIAFWFIFPLLAGLDKKRRLMIQIPGVAAMLTSVFLFTKLHDEIINIATLFGLIALVGTFAALKKLKLTRLLLTGLFNLFLVGINNLLYYNNGLYYLPVVQKITFLYFLFWISLVNICLINKMKKDQLLQQDLNSRHQPSSRHH